MSRIADFFRSNSSAAPGRIDPTSAGLAVAIIGVIAFAAYSALALYTGYGIEVESIFESLLPGYTLSLPGTIVGVIWVFSSGFLMGSVTAWTYNKLIK